MLLQDITFWKFLGFCMELDYILWKKSSEVGTDKHGKRTASVSVEADFRIVDSVCRETLVSVELETSTS